MTGPPGSGAGRSGVDRPTAVLVLHGTRRPAGGHTARRIAARIAARLGVRVPVACADVVPPTLAAVLGTVPGRAVVLPAFLASGYHVRTDLPAQLATIGRIGQLSAAGRVVQLGAARRLAGGCDVLLAPALGPDPLVVAALADRARAAGWRPGDSLVLAAAGSRDPAATADVRAAAALLSARLGTPVPIGYVAAEPSVSTVVAAQHRRGRRVVIASYLLAPGHFHDRLASMGATAVAAPLGDHPDVVMALCTRYHAALPGFTPRRLTGNLSRRGTGG